MVAKAGLLARLVGSGAAVVLVAGCASGGTGSGRDTSRALERPLTAPTTGAVRTLGQLEARVGAAVRAAGWVHIHQEMAQSDAGEDRVSWDADVRTGTSPAARVRLTIGSRTSQAIHVGGRLYVLDPAAARPGAGGARTTWAELSERDLLRRSPLLASVVVASLDFGSGSAGDLLGRYDGGLPAEEVAPGRYTVRLTPKQWLAGLDGGVRADYAAWVEAEEVTEIDVQLTLDDRDRPIREILFVQPNSAQLTIEAAYSRWGSPVTIVPPPGASARG